MDSPAADRSTSDAAAGGPASHAAAGGPATHAEPMRVLALGAIGVVFGDIGTSPLYAFRDALGQAAADGIVASEIYGVLSLAVWALILVVTVKYVLFLMRADNEGQGGVLSLMALAQRGLRKRSMIVLTLGAVGASLFYGDGIITPALSVLSAVEGLQTVPALAGVVSQQIVIFISLIILVALFMIQSRGTARVASLFGPVCLVWFISIAALGAIHIADDPAILLAINPIHAIRFMQTHGMLGLFVLGAVFLTVTGAEALTADMGHFGRLPIQWGWFIVVFPSLLLNYFGQGAFALAALEHAARHHQVFTNQNWFFLMSPAAVRVPLILLAMAATVIASQAVITGAYSLTQQAIQLGLLPRMVIRQTSASTAGQIYIPIINTLLFIGVVILVLGFRTSSSMAAAYGIAVTGTMVVTTCLAFIVVYRLWKWKLPLAIAFIAPFLAIDLIFFGANILRVIEGGWVPLLIGAIVGLIIATWIRGRRLIADSTRDIGVGLVDVTRALSARPPERVTGTAVFLTGNPDVAPTALMHNLKHNKILHDRNLIICVKTLNIPHFHGAERLRLERLDDNFYRGTMTYGFMEQPDVPADLAGELAAHDVAFKPNETSYFVGRNLVRPSAGRGMPFWQDLMFIFLQKNAADPTSFFKIPPNRVVELGTHVTV